MSIKFYNTMTKKKEVFKPLKKEVRMYVCGPTVYGPIHIGNARTFMTFDILNRYLRYKGFKVKYVQNITDVGHLTDVGEDKIMKGAAKMKMDVFEFVELMIKNYLEDLKSLNIKKPDLMPRASKLVKDMIETIKKIIKNGYAYESNGFVYYDISKFKKYGKLSNQNPDYLNKQRKETHGNKKHEGDFVLWIPAPKDYPMKWKSPWGVGFPGWHIECSTMSSKYLGLPIDIHGGGKDLAFPHHENEIAQAEAATGKKLCNLWMHGEFILIGGEKMAKSLNNFITTRDFIKEHGPQATRYFLLSSHYRTEINVTDKSIKNAKIIVRKFKDFMYRLNSIKTGKENKNVSKLIKIVKKKFEDSMDNDLNIPEALAKIFEFMKEINSLNDMNKKNAKEVYNTMLEFDKVLGLNLGVKKEKIPKDIHELLKDREKARKKKDFNKADQIRNQISKKGWIVEDSESGPRLRKK